MPKQSKPFKQPTYRKPKEPSHCSSDPRASQRSNFSSWSNYLLIAGLALLGGAYLATRERNSENPAPKSQVVYSSQVNEQKVLDMARAALAAKSGPVQVQLPDSDAATTLIKTANIPQAEVRGRISASCCELIVLSSASHSIQRLVGSTPTGSTHVGLSMAVGNFGGSLRGVSLIRPYTTPEELFVHGGLQQALDVSIGTGITDLPTLVGRNKLFAKLRHSNPFRSTTATFHGESGSDAGLKIALSAYAIHRKLLVVYGLEKLTQVHFVNSAVHEGVHAGCLRRDILDNLANLSQKSGEEFGYLGELAYGADPQLVLRDILIGSMPALLTGKQNPVFSGLLDKFLQISGCSILELPDQKPEKLRSWAKTILDYMSARAYDMRFTDLFSISDSQRIIRQANALYEQ
ncbi:hypothetical protein HZC07_03600 [Candidatus Micrarchaeota archaeon]|nr:hypothetical protein [Candidatus Micrarchaeota archaeon]